MQKNTIGSPPWCFTKLVLSKEQKVANASAVAVAGSVAATVSGSMTIRAGFAAVVFAVFNDVMPFGDFAFAVRTGAFGISRSAHRNNI